MIVGITGAGSTAATRLEAYVSKGGAHTAGVSSGRRVEETGINLIRLRVLGAERASVSSVRPID